MTEIIPAILSTNYEDMKNKIALVRNIAPIVQIDFCDGIFVPSKTWPFSTGGFSDFSFVNIMDEKEGMPFWEDIDFELDLMVYEAILNFDIYTKLSPKRIVFHIEAVGDLEEFKCFLEGIDKYIKDEIEIGVAINIQTSLEKIFPLINDIDFVQCMGIEKIGFQDQVFDKKVIKQITTLRHNYPEIIISVDGGVNENNAPALVKAGANRLIIGSALNKKPDLKEAIKKFESF